MYLFRIHGPLFNYDDAGPIWLKIWIVGLFRPQTTSNSPHRVLERRTYLQIASTKTIVLYTPTSRTLAFLRNTSENTETMTQDSAPWRDKPQKAETMTIYIQGTLNDSELSYLQHRTEVIRASGRRFQTPKLCWLNCRSRILRLEVYLKLSSYSPQRRSGYNLGVYSFGPTIMYLPYSIHRESGSTSNENDSIYAAPQLNRFCVKLFQNFKGRLDSTRFECNPQDEESELLTQKPRQLSLTTLTRTRTKSKCKKKNSFIHSIAGTPRAHRAGFRSHPASSRRSPSPNPRRVRCKQRDAATLDSAPRRMESSGHGHGCDPRGRDLHPDLRRSKSEGDEGARGGDAVAPMRARRAPHGTDATGGTGHVVYKGKEGGKEGRREGGRGAADLLCMSDPRAASQCGEDRQMGDKSGGWERGLSRVGGEWLSSQGCAAAARLDGSAHGDATVRSLSRRGHGEQREGRENAGEGGNECDVSVARDVRSARVRLTAPRQVVRGVTPPLTARRGGKNHDEHARSREGARARRIEESGNEKRTRLHTSSMSTCFSGIVGGAVGDGERVLGAVGQ
ncbi:hypothetical protein DFH06DRAFT_1144649 [Mycena polygramma]|nr:hypothetical protein DFH06DRAFT_1144649 [Mycena polygramma]